MMWLLMMFVARWQAAHRPMDTEHLALNTSNAIVYPEDLMKGHLIPDGSFFQDKKGEFIQPVYHKHPSVFISGQSNITFQK